jgi:hypothetical protein
MSLLREKSEDVYLLWSQLMIKGSLLIFLGFLSVFALMIVFTVLRVQHRGRIDGPIPVVVKTETTGDKWWKPWDKNS